MSRNILGHPDRYRRVKIGSAIVGGRGGVIRPHVPVAVPEYIDLERIGALEAKIKGLESALRGQIENRRQDAAG